jgi:hypothetical protein
VIRETDSLFSSSIDRFVNREAVSFDAGGPDSGVDSIRARGGRSQLMSHRRIASTGHKSAPGYSPTRSKLAATVPPGEFDRASVDRSSCLSGE